MKKSAGGARASAVDRVREIYGDHALAAERFFSDGAISVEAVAGAFVTALRTGRTLLFFGNGGSAADAQHLAAEFVNRFTSDRPGLAALALTTDTSVLTSISNDSDFSQVFARQIQALGRKGDVAVGITTSGRSPNVLEGLRAAKAQGLVTIGFSGGNDQPMRDLCDLQIRVPSTTTARVQEIHILVGHIVCQLVDETMFPETRGAGPRGPERTAPSRRV